MVGVTPRKMAEKPFSEADASSIHSKNGARHMSPNLVFDSDQTGHLVPAPDLGPGRPMPGGPRLVQKKRPQVGAPMVGPLSRPPVPGDLKLDRSRDALLTAFGKATLEDRYLLEGESYQDMVPGGACAYAADVDHAQRIYDSPSRLWFMPATPI